MSDLDRVRQRLAASQRLAVLTGAGISAESGVPTFRGPGGLWCNHRAEDLATPEAFHRDPKLVWEWYNMRRTALVGVQPNPGHHALAVMQEKLPGFNLVTQNVDGLHAVAGNSDPVEIHGNIWKVRCTACHAITGDHRVPIPTPPSCAACGALLRPHIVWFGESLDSDVLERAFAAFEYCDVALIVGTSGVVQPAASLADLARRRGAFVVEVNLEPTPATGVVDVALHGRAGEILPQLLPG
ncbi:MAG: NAD-dependent deacylase [Nitrospirota bacterium]|nr:NAD-dependent deacylase [Nitrospirota bacterium]